MKRNSHWLVRLAVALAAGTTVIYFALQAAWRGTSYNPDLDSGQWRTQIALSYLNQTLEEYRTKHHTLPLSLASLHPSPNVLVTQERDGTIRDGWGHPFIYRVHGNEATIISLGRDGRPGGGDAPPRWYEILIPLLLWSWVFELWLPHTRPFGRLAISDPADILFYALGALLASLFWHQRYRVQRTS